MKSFLLPIVVLFLVAILAFVDCVGGFGYGDYGYDYIVPKTAVGPNILYGGYTVSSSSVSGPLSKPGLLTSSYYPGHYYPPYPYYYHPKPYTFLYTPKILPYKIQGRITKCSCQNPNKSSKAVSPTAVTKKDEKEKESKKNKKKK